VSRIRAASQLRHRRGRYFDCAMNGPTNIVVMDERGNTARQSPSYDVHDKNGIVQVVDHTLEASGPARSRSPANWISPHIFAR